MRMYRCESCGPPWGFNLISYDVVNKVHLSGSISEARRPPALLLVLHILKSHPERTDALHCRPGKTYRGF